jgi:HK97 family phage major capsid protein
MNLMEIVDKRNLKTKELESITEKVKLEKRKMNEDEDINFKKIKVEVENLNKQIDDIKEADSKAERSDVNTKNNEKNMNNFSLVKTIRDIAEKRALSEESIEMINAGREEFRKSGFDTIGNIVLPANFLQTRSDILAGTQYAGQEIVATEKGVLLGSLQAKTVLGQAGATFVSLEGNYSQPIYAGTTSYWVDEVSGATNGGGAFSQVDFAPKRLVSKIVISNKFLKQDQNGAEGIILNDLVKSIMVKVENTVFDATASSSTRPAGLFYGASWDTSLSGATTFGKMIGMKAKVDTANALTGNLAYITNPTLAAVLETTPQATNSSLMILNNGKVGGYPVLITSNIGATASNQNIVFGNFSDYIVAQWGGIELIVDPYSRADYGEVVITSNTFWDFKYRRSASFSLNCLA